MKLFAVAFGVVCAVAVALFVVTFALLLVFEQSQAVGAASALAALPIMAFPKLGELLEQQNARKRLAAGTRTPVYDFRAFQIAWPLMVVYGTIVLFAVVEGTGLIAGSVGAVGELERVGALLAVTAFPATILGMYFVGRWIGTRCARRGVVAILLVVVLTIVSVIAADELLLDDETHKKIFQHERMDYQFILSTFAIRLCIFAPTGLIGYWRGQKQRLSKYLHYLLSVLPPETRDTVVELAFEEAQKASASAGLALHPRPNVEVLGGRLTDIRGISLRPSFIK